jgi:hypothetical protein
LQVLTHLEGGSFPADPKDLTHEMLDFWLQRFICEIRRKNGDPYPPNTPMHRQYRDICVTNVKK